MQAFQSSQAIVAEYLLSYIYLIYNMAIFSVMLTNTQSRRTKILVDQILF